MPITNRILENFARVLLEVGMDLRPGDKLSVSVTEKTLPIVREVARRAWAMGVTDIDYRFADDSLDLAFFENAGEEALSYYPDFQIDFQKAKLEAGYHRLSIIDASPSLLKDVPTDKLGKRQRLVSSKSRPLMRYYMENKLKWCVASYPTQTWAEEVLPGDPEALSKLTEAWIHINRLDTADPVEAWRAHDAMLKKHESWLNGMDFDHLLYEAPGTKLKVGLVRGHSWVGGSSVLEAGDVFMANIPTEEIFTMPDKHRIDGTLSSTLPLSLHGKLIEGMRFTFENGKLVHFDADAGRESLEELFSTDENATRLGEVAIVPVDSPIYQSKLIFKETLFDENASCHFAFGNAYSENLPGSEEFTDEQKEERGMNDSLIHVDFMVGSEELSITGVQKDGTEVPILVKGRWAEV